VPAEQIASGTTRASLIVVTNYKAGAEWMPRNRTRGEGAFSLFRHSVAARQRPSEVLSAVSLLSREAEVISGVRGDADQVVRALFRKARQRASTR
jgi:hypothetical protein